VSIIILYIRINLAVYVISMNYYK